MKLSFWTIIIMASSIAFGILSFAYFHQWVPTMTAKKQYDDYRALLETEIAKDRQVTKRLTEAKQTVQREADKWNVYVASRTPAADINKGGINLTVNPYQLSVDTQKFRNSVQRAIDIQVKKGGVTVLSDVSIPGPQSTDAANSLLADYYGYGTYKFPVVIYDLGPITVSGTYEQIKANVLSYRSMPNYLAVADGLQITGTSPNLTGTYNLTIVGFLRGKELGAPVPEGGAAAGAGGAQGLGAPPGRGPGMMPGGMGPGATGAPGGAPTMRPGIGGPGGA